MPRPGAGGMGGHGAPPRGGHGAPPRGGHGAPPPPPPRGGHHGGGALEHALHDVARAIDRATAPPPPPHHHHAPPPPPSYGHHHHGFCPHHPLPFGLMLRLDTFGWDDMDRLRGILRDMREGYRLRPEDENYLRRIFHRMPSPHEVADLYRWCEDEYRYR